MNYYLTRFFKTQKHLVVIFLLLMVFLSDSLSLCLAKDKPLVVKEYSKQGQLIRTWPGRKVFDDVMPDLCSKSRKKAYKLAVSSLAVCSAAAAVCATPMGCVMGGWIVGVTCGGLVAAFTDKVVSYDSCCSSIKKSSVRGWTAGELRDAALCDLCKSEHDLLSDACGS